MALFSAFRESCGIARGLAGRGNSLNVWHTCQSLSFADLPTDHDRGIVPSFSIHSQDFQAWQQDPNKDAALLTDGLASQELSLHSLEELRARGNLEVPVEASLKGADYRNGLIDSESKEFQADVPVPLSVVLDHIEERETVDGANSGLTLYLAQKDIREHLPWLALDPSKLPLVGLDERIYQQSIWLGPKGTRTPLHGDPYYNLLCQVWGKKRVRIYDPAHKEQLYPFNNPVLKNTSQIASTDHIDISRFPKFPDAAYQECLLGPGQILFIPKKAWHEVLSLSGSFSVSFWWT